MQKAVVVKLGSGPSKHRAVSLPHPPPGAHPLSTFAGAHPPPGRDPTPAAAELIRQVFRSWRDEYIHERACRAEERRERQEEARRERRDRAKAKPKAQVRVSRKAAASELPPAVAVGRSSWREVRLELAREGI